jgi:hypothetical protein
MSDFDTAVKVWAGKCLGSNPADIESVNLTATMSGGCSSCSYEIPSVEVRYRPGYRVAFAELDLGERDFGALIREIVECSPESTESLAGKG